MARRTTKRLGKDAKAVVLAKYLHPSKIISTTLTNLESNHRLQDCIVIRMEVKKVNRRDQLVIVMKHDDFKTHDGALEEIYCVSRWCRVTEEGSSDYFFDKEEGGGTVATRNEIVTAEIQVELPAVVENIHNRGFLNVDLLNLNGDVEVDDDNAPAPEMYQLRMQM